MTRSYHLAFFVAGGFFTVAACFGIFVRFVALRNSTMINDHDLTTDQRLPLKNSTVQEA